VQDPTELGRNRTGIQLSPLVEELLFDQADDEPGAVGAVQSPEGTSLARLRTDYLQEADALGSIPPPGTATGMIATGAKMLTGKRIHVFVDKVAERLAFERGGTRLYDAVIVKALSLAEGTPVTIDRLRQIREQEANHAMLLAETLSELGADPTAQTPCADLVGVQAQGLLQSVSDPRTSLTQTISSALAAELIDVASWELLSTLARSVGQESMADRFDQALVHEQQHLETLRAWYEQLVTSESRLLS
jgi:ferritin-like metal-binding protein YciE